MTKDTTTKEYQDKIVKKRLTKRDANMKTKKKQHREHMQDVHDEAYNKALDIISKK